MRHISNRLRPIRHPGDCRGMRIRTLDNAMYQRMLAAVGFTPVVIDVRDLVRAVEAHEVDAQENPLTNTVNFGLHRTHRHLSLTSHFHGVALLLANRTWFEGLAPAIQSAVLAAAADAAAAQRQWAIDEDAVCLERLRREGVAIVPAEEIDFAAFRALVSDPPGRVHHSSTRHPGRTPDQAGEPTTSSAPSRDLGRCNSPHEVPDSLACGSASGMTGAMVSDPQGLTPSMGACPTRGVLAALAGAALL